MLFDETWFYAPAEDKGASVALPEDEAHHCRVLRLRPGAEIVVTNGKGSAFRARLESEGEGARAQILERVAFDPEPPGLALALGLLKGRDVELPVAAACEFALGDVFLLKTDHSSEFQGQDFGRLQERLRQKSLMALKQAKKTWLTRIHPPQDMRAWRVAHREVPLAVAHPGEDTLPAPPPARLHVLIGPEGGFSAEELRFLLEEEGAYRLSLGPTRLRAVHAPIAALGNLMGRFR